MTPSEAEQAAQSDSDTKDAKKRSKNFGLSPPQTEVSGILELGFVWVFVQLIHRPMTKNQLYKTQTLPN